MAWYCVVSTAALSRVSQDPSLFDSNTSLRGTSYPCVFATKFQQTLQSLCLSSWPPAPLAARPQTPLSAFLSGHRVAEKLGTPVCRNSPSGAPVLTCCINLCYNFTCLISGRAVLGVGVGGYGGRLDGARLTEP